MAFTHWTVRVVKLVAVVTIVGVPLAAWAPTASAGGCFYLPASALAKAVGFPHATSYLDTPPNPGGGGPAVFSLCRAIAWEGSTPTTKTEAEEKVASGTGVAVVIKTEEPNPSATAEQVEQWEEDYARTVTNFLKAGQAVALATHGTTLTLPTFGAEYDHAFTASAGPKRGAVGIWYDEKGHAFITIGITGGIKNPGAALKKIAAKAVPSFGL